MDETRLDLLLDAALETGEPPADATPEERQQVLALLAGVGALRGAAAAADAEARASMPIARARFGRFVIDNRPAPAVAPKAVRQPKQGLLARLFSRGPGSSLVWTAAGVAVLAVLALGGSQVLFGGAGTAQAFEPGDYVQLEGVVSEVSGEGDARTIRVASGLSDEALNISASADTLLADGTTLDLATIKPGTVVMVAGVVGKDRRIAARSLSLSEDQSSQPGGPKPKKIDFKQLKQLKSALAGSVITLALAPDGTHGRVLIEAADGARFLVEVDQESAGRLFELTSAIGARVNVQGPGPGQGPRFALKVDDPGPHPSGGASPPLSGGSNSPAAGSSPPQRSSPASARSPGSSPSQAPAVTPAASPSTAAPGANNPPPPGGQQPAGGAGAGLSFRGAVVSRDGNVLTVQGDRGPVTVILRRETHIFVGDSGLIRERILDGRDSIIGHTITVTGGFDRAAGRMLADTIAVGPKPK